MLTKDSFSLTHFFLYYQTMENTKNYLYTMFSIETNYLYTLIIFEIYAY